MTVRELIEELSAYEQDARVVVDGYEGGFDEPVIGVTGVSIDFNWDGERKREAWNGRHDYGDGGSTSVRAVVIGRR